MNLQLWLLKEIKTLKNGVLLNTPTTDPPTTDQLTTIHRPTDPTTK